MQYFHYANAYEEDRSVDEALFSLESYQGQKCEDAERERETSPRNLRLGESGIEVRPHPK